MANNTELNIVATEGIELKNAALKVATESIIAIGKELKTNLYKVAAIMAKVADEKLYEEDGFKNVSEWGKKCLGFKKSQTYALCKIGKGYTAENMLESKLTHDEGNDFSVTQVVAMFPLGDVTAMDKAIAENDITPDLTVTEIKKKVKELTKTESNTTESNTTETDEESETENAEPLDVVNVEYAVYTRTASVFAKNREFIYRGIYEEYSLESLHKIVESMGVKSNILYLGTAASLPGDEPMKGFRNYVELENGEVIVISWDEIKESPVPATR